MGTLDLFSCMGTRGAWQQTTRSQSAGFPPKKVWLEGLLDSVYLYYTHTYIHRYITLHYIIVYYIISYHIIVYYIMLYYIILYHTILYHIILYHIISYHITLDHSTPLPGHSLIWLQLSSYVSLNFILHDPTPETSHLPNVLQKNTLCT